MARMNLFEGLRRVFPDLGAYTPLCFYHFANLQNGHYIYYSEGSLGDIQLVLLGARPPESIEPPLAPPNTVPPQVEDLIMWAFGKAIIEFEATLYQKFHILSGDIVVGKNEFRWHLENMEERGLLASSTYKGVPSWSRLK